MSGGETTTLGAPKLIEAEITGVLCWNYPPGGSDRETLEVTLKRLTHFMESGMPQSFAIVGREFMPDMNPMRYVTLEGFSASERAGRGGDFDITLHLKEYRPKIVEKLVENPDGSWSVKRVRPDYVTEPERLRFEAMKAKRAMGFPLGGVVTKDGDVFIKNAGRALLFLKMFKEYWEKHIYIDENKRIYFKNGYNIKTLDEVNEIKFGASLSPALPNFMAPAAAPALAEYSVLSAGHRFENVYTIGGETCYVSLDEVIKAFGGRKGSDDSSIYVTAKFGPANSAYKETLVVVVPSKGAAGQSECAMFSTRTQRPEKGKIRWSRPRGAEVYLELNDFLAAYGEAFKEELKNNKKPKIEKVEKIYISDGRLAQWLKNIEAPPMGSDDYVYGADNSILWIKPQNANDGYVTIGYGHALQDKDDVKYGFSVFDKQSEEAVEKSIAEQMSRYGSYAENPAVLSPYQALELMEKDLKEKREATMKSVEKKGIIYSDVVSF